MPGLVGLYRWYLYLPEPELAQEILEYVICLVKPIMVAHNWKVKVLSEYLPEEKRLLGTNYVNEGEIFLRLRYNKDPGKFRSIDSIVDIMLHELCHFDHFHHTLAFYELLDDVRRELNALKANGHTGIEAQASSWI